MIKDEALYVEVGGELCLLDGGIIGKETEVNAEAISLEEAEKHDQLPL